MDDHDLLQRVDEKVSALHSRFDILEEDIKRRLVDHKKDDEKFVTKVEFDSVKWLGGVVGAVVTFLLGLLTLLKK
ncbi:hypothetical protein A2635_01050 [Candidatus Peribacteria bacterium RIFCSPHIGHO2_01_FULL_51_9]|nr:MAG: hypothetical protein A2635_01050 [Candidatus Peribacteria bacterium RIFCSPHIGHO2_01_FULL_51_9]